MKGRRSFAIGMAACLATLASPGAGIPAQLRHADQRAKAPQSPAALLQQARAALASGRVEEAVRLADEVLATAPADREAVGVKIDAFVLAKDLDTALDVYEDHLARQSHEDVELLQSIARAELRALAGTDFGSIRALALERLARAGDVAARSALVEASRGEGDTGEGRAATEALARLGDDLAVRQLASQARDGLPDSRLIAVRVLKDTTPTPAVVAALRQAAGEAHPVLRAAAFDAIGALGAGEAMGALKTALTDESFFVRLAAAAALKRLGDAGGDEILTQALESRIADVRLTAARAFQGTDDKTWIDAVLPLLQSREDLNRLAAAELLLAERRAAALDVLTRAAADANPTIRTEAARALSRSRELSLLRPLLRDREMWVRLQAAGAIVNPANSAIPPSM